MVQDAGYHGVAGSAEDYTRWGVKWWDWCDIIPEGVQSEEAMCKKMHVAFFDYKLRVGRVKELIVAKKATVVGKISDK